METTENNEVVEIDVEALLRSKSPKLLRIIPGFVISYLKRIIHQDEINKALHDFKDYYGLDFIDRILSVFGADIRVEGLENIKPGQRYIIASNHPLGGLDGMALMQAVGKVRCDILFPVNDLLLFLPNIRSLFIPINKHGSNSQNLKILDDSFASDSTILYFPAGLCSRKQRGGILDLEWKKTFLTKAKKFQRDIIPVHIDGRNSNFFYNLALIRKLLGIKANIEMLYLSDEMFKQKEKHICIRFGKPIPYTTFTKAHSDQEWSQKLKDHVYAIGKGEDNFDKILN